MQHLRFSVPKSDRMRRRILAALVTEAEQYARDLALEPIAPGSPKPMEAAARIEGWQARLGQFQRAADNAVARARSFAGLSRGARQDMDRLRTRLHQRDEVEAYYARLMVAVAAIHEALNGPDEILDGMKEMIERLLKEDAPYPGRETLEEVIVQQAPDTPFVPNGQPGAVGGTPLDVVVLAMGFCALVIHKLRSKT
ncbi:hypothetical protein [Jannaschia aquimarina]|uniref:Uncharacterized protein n=1 Tax=Jannaschia aquimarina TaxID=935700 RepID=A0A0D1EFG7_9RHOB|nr:hypothetical protein [Jannaschia aquimarina]KIT14640.1 hypothetical protein jaqu_35820 [Jannaschia aquimarina]SNT37546.1 hypothetical protein SAMN05421775_11371 [Jannaschia aquimarina]